MSNVELKAVATSGLMPSPLVRHPANPILTARDVPYHATLLFNAGVCKYEGKYLMVFRNDYGRWGDTTFDGTNLGLATSDDGIAWTVAAQPVIDLAAAKKLAQPHMPHRDANHEIFRFYDPRLTVIDGKLHMCFAVDTRHGVIGGLGVFHSLDRFEVLSLSTPDNRNMVLFPEKIGGRCMISPTKAGSAASIAARSGRTSEVAITVPSASSESVSAPQWMVKR